MNPDASCEIYDAIVVGAGATGGVAAKELSERGLRVLVLDAGPQLSPDVVKNTPLKTNALRFHYLTSRQQSYQALHPGYWKVNPTLFVNEKDNPYTTPGDRPFYWMRGRQVGGRSLTWGGITLRLSDYEFQAASRDGYGENWPLTHQELAPYYDRLEQFFQVKGARDGLRQLPDGPYAPAADLTPAEQHLKTVVAQQWPDRDLIVSRGFPLHQPTAANPWPRSSSLGSSLKAAMATGRVTLQPDAVVSHVMFDPQSRRARGIGYIHRTSHQAREVQARLVVLCASTLESVRILLHSTEVHQPGGLANQSGVLGRYLIDHISTMSFFTLPAFQQPDRPFDLSGCDSFFIPRFSNLEGPQESFLRGYGLWGGVQRVPIPPAVSKVGNQAIGFLVGHGEVLARAENRLELDRSCVDAWGIPVPHIDMTWSDNEYQMRAHMQSQIQTLVAQAGGQCLELPELFRAPFLAAPLRWIEAKSMTATPPGYYVHELGGARMGSSPTSSVLNPFNQCWDAPNLLVVDGACWPSAGWQNPTLTEMAIAARACELAVKTLKYG